MSRPIPVAAATLAALMLAAAGAAAMPDPGALRLILRGAPARPALHPAALAQPMAVLPPSLAQVPARPASPLDLGLARADADADGRLSTAEIAAMAAAALPALSEMVSTARRPGS